MEEDIKILKELIQNYRDCGIGDYPSMILEFSLNLSEIQAMINVLNELERLKKENERLKEKHKITCELNVGLLENTKECIPKQVIRDKLEELEEDNYDGEQYQLEIQGKIELLKELLGDE